MSESKADTTAMLTEMRVQIRLWEQAEFGSRKEFDAAEAATRLMAELDAALCDGAELPASWQRAQYPAENEVNDWLGPDGGDNLHGYEPETKDERRAGKSNWKQRERPL